MKTNRILPLIVVGAFVCAVASCVSRNNNSLDSQRSKVSRDARDIPDDKTCRWLLGVPGHPKIPGWTESHFSYSFFVWDAEVKANENVMVEFKGPYLNHRLFSYDMQDLVTDNVDAFYDQRLHPDPGSRNPFLPGSDRTTPITRPSPMPSEDPTNYLASMVDTYTLRFVPARYASKFTAQQIDELNIKFVGATNDQRLNALKYPMLSFRSWYSERTNLRRDFRLVSKEMAPARAYVLPEPNAVSGAQLVQRLQDARGSLDRTKCPNLVEAAGRVQKVFQDAGQQMQNALAGIRDRLGPQQQEEAEVEVAKARRNFFQQVGSALSNLRNRGRGEVTEEVVQPADRGRPGVFKYFFNNGKFKSGTSEYLVADVDLAEGDTAVMILKKPTSEEDRPDIGTRDEPLASAAGNIKGNKEVRAFSVCLLDSVGFTAECYGDRLFTGGPYLYLVASPGKTNETLERQYSNHPVFKVGGWEGTPLFESWEVVDREYLLWRKEAGIGNIGIRLPALGKNHPRFWLNYVLPSESFKGRPTSVFTGGQSDSWKPTIEAGQVKLGEYNPLMVQCPHTDFQICIDKIQEINGGAQ